MACGATGADRGWQRLFGLCGRLLCLVVALGAAPKVSAEKMPLPDWSASHLTCAASVRERDLLACTLTVVRGALDRFNGPAGAEWTVSLPAQALFAAADLEAGATFDPDRRVLFGLAEVVPGGARTIAFRLIAAPETDGTRLTVRASVAGAAPAHLESTAEVEARRQQGDALNAGAPSDTTAGRWVMGFLLTGPIFIGACVLMGGRRSGVPGLAFAAWIGIGFLLVFGTMAREDWRILADYHQAECVVTDTGVHTQVSGRGRHAVNISEPFVAVRFELAGRTHFGTGFDSGSHLRKAGGTWPRRELQALGPGAAIPCWFDPQDPARIVVLRGPGGAYLFALLPLGLMWIVARPLWRALTRRRLASGNFR